MKALLFPALLLASACSTDASFEQQYIIRPDVLPDPVEIAATAPRLSLARPQVAEHIEGLTLVRLDGRVDHLHYSHFAAPVPEIVGEWMTSLLTASGQVRWALPAGLASKADLALQIRVMRFELEEVAPAAGGLRAEVLLEAVLLHGGTSEVLATRRARGGLVAKGNTPAALVESLREALRQAAENLRDTLVPLFVAPPAAPSAAVPHSCRSAAFVQPLP